MHMYEMTLGNHSRTFDGSQPRVNAVVRRWRQRLGKGVQRRGRVPQVQLAEQIQCLSASCGQELKAASEQR